MSANHSTGLNVLYAVDSAQEGFEGIDGGVGVIDPQAVSLNVPDNERGCGKYVSDAVRELFQDQCSRLLEKIVAWRMSALAEEHHLLLTTQIGARPGRSTVTALEMLTKQIQTV